MISAGMRLSSGGSPNSVNEIGHAIQNGSDGPHDNIENPDKNFLPRQCSRLVKLEQGPERPQDNPYQEDRHYHFCTTFLMASNALDLAARV